jgi:NarL family two-component system response regulator LiaR
MQSKVDLEAAGSCAKVQMNEIKVALVDDDSGWIKAMISFLNNEDDMRVVGTAVNPDDSIALAKTIDIDVFLIDVDLGINRLNGIKVAAKIMEISECKIVILTCLKDEDIVTDAFAVGVVQFVSKENFLEIPKVIREVYNNFFSPTQILAKNYFRLKQDELLKELTPKEREIYDLLANGHSRNDIATKLVITNNTLKSQIKSIFKKLQVHSCKEAVNKIKK